MNRILTNFRENPDSTFHDSSSNPVHPKNLENPDSAFHESSSNPAHPENPANPDSPSRRFVKILILIHN